MASLHAIRQSTEISKGGKWGLGARRRHHSSETFREQRSIRMATCFGLHSSTGFLVSQLWMANICSFWCSPFKVFPEKVSLSLTLHFSSLILSSCDHRPQADNIKLEKQTPYKAQQRETHKTHHSKKTQKHTTQTQFVKMQELASH